MKVSNILRYAFNTISMIVCAFGVIYAFLYDKSESFNQMYEEYDVAVIVVTVATLAITEIVNILILLTRCSRSDGKYHVKKSLIFYSLLWLISASGALIKLNGLLAIELAMLLIDPILFNIGSMLEFDEIKEVETLFEEEDD